MADKPTVVSCILAALAGVCFISGISLLSNEGSAVKNGVCEKTDFND